MSPPLTLLPSPLSFIFVKEYNLRKKYSISCNTKNINYF